MGSSNDIIDIQRLAAGVILGASDTTLATSNAIGCTISRTAVGAYQAKLAQGVVGPTGILGPEGQVKAQSRTAGVSVRVRYDVAGDGGTTIGFDGANDSTLAAADCDFDFIIQRTVSES